MTIRMQLLVAGMLLGLGEVARGQETAPVPLKVLSERYSMALTRAGVSEEDTRTESETPELTPVGPLNPERAPARPRPSGGPTMGVSLLGVDQDHFVEPWAYRTDSPPAGYSANDPTWQAYVAEAAANDRVAEAYGSQIREINTTIQSLRQDLRQSTDPGRSDQLRAQIARWEEERDETRRKMYAAQSDKERKALANQHFDRWADWYNGRHPDQ